MKKIFVLSLAALMALSMTACSNNSDSGTSTPAENSSASTDNSTSAPAPAAGDLKFGQVNYAAHGSKSFAVASVVMQGDKIAAAYVDEYQMLPAAEVTGVPNGETMFANDPEGKVLASKKVNNDYYSNMIKEKGKATSTYKANIELIEDYAVGKTVAELESAMEGKDAAQVVELVAGSTLVDTQGYLNAIIEAAKAAQ